MSIPPLVCSTPPPPEQCEEDKDFTDFDIAYNLSQEDESNDYDYETYSTYSDYQMPNAIDKNFEEAKGNIVIESVSKINEEVIENIDSTIDSVLDANEKSLDTLKNEEVILEDLNLVLTDEIISSVKDYHELSKSVQDSNFNDTEFKTNMVEDVISKSHLCKDYVSNSNRLECLNQEHEEVLDNYQNIDLETKHNAPYTHKIVENTYNKEDLHVIYESKSNLKVESVSENPTESVDLNDYNTAAEHTESKVVLEKQVVMPKLDDDEFSDFDDFQEHNPNGAAVVDVCDNPWKSNEIEDISSNNFEANFDHDDFSNPDNSTRDNFYAKFEEQTDIGVDDSFGDFDNFKSSEIPQNFSGHQATMFNFQLTDNENQFTDSINNVIISIFELNISEDIVEFDGKMESLLCETWCHLKDTDFRQPYLVNWNSSLGQKTLLKALCIDSRNILYGPKWSFGMPKYATNLTNAPLQPQKSIVTPTTSQMKMTISSTQSMKTSDPFSSSPPTDVQESSSADNQTPNDTRQNDFYMFETVTTKVDNILSNTLAIQPLRQINLPDTHIFTPTDSETPRSKKIHYDCTPSVLVPSVNPEQFEDRQDNFIPQDVTENSLKNSDDYSDFEYFQHFPNTNLSTVKNVTNNLSNENGISQDVPKSSVPNSYQIQILEPIKVEPIMPTLNWPDPGEVKECYDDFSDFVSSSTWNIDKDNEIKKINETGRENVTCLNDINNTADNEKHVINTDFDDYFDTFKSAVPLPKFIDSKKKVLEHNIAPNNNDSSLFNLANKKTDRHNVNSMNDVVYSSATSFTNIQTNNSIQSNDFSQLSNHTENRLNPIHVTTKTPILQSHTVLKPTPSKSIPQNQQKAGQILQPLSLESYSQINWPNPGIDLYDLTRFNPVETVHSMKNEASGVHSKRGSPVHHQTPRHIQMDDDIWGDFVSSKPNIQQPAKNPSTNLDDDEWTDFVSSPNVKLQNGLNTISLNVHTSLNLQKSSSLSRYATSSSQKQVDIPTLNYITPKSNAKSYSDKHFQNL